MSVEQLLELREMIDSKLDGGMSKEEIEQIEWDQSFTLTERVDYGYGYSCYGPI